MENGSGSVGYVPYQPGFEGKSNYRNFIVPAGHPLHGVVSDFYQFDSPAPGGEVCVIPDGCIDLLFRYDDKGVTKTLVGYHLKKVIVPVDQAGSAFGVRFVPGGLSDIVKLQTSELIGEQAPLTDFLKRDILLDQMDEILDFGRRVETMTAYLYQKIHKSYGPTNVVKYCTERIVRSQGSIPVRELSEQSGYTVRYLRNLYHQHVGISPKELCEIIQFQASFFKLSHLHKEKKDISLSDFAVSAGYYDQSHMNKCYQKMVGSLPQKFYAEMFPEHHSQEEFL